jgi:hypothetical protein
VKRAFADALLAQIHQARLGRDEAAASGRVSRSYLLSLLKAECHASIGTMISLAEGLGMRPEELIAKTMEHLSRLRTASDRSEPPVDRPP